MASAMMLSGQAIRLMGFNTVPRLSIGAFSPKRAAQVQYAEIRGLLRQMFTKNIAQSRRYELVAFARGSSDIGITTPSPAHTIMQFYSSINEKNLKQLANLLSDDCFLDDYSFPEPFQGKQEVLNYLKQLTTSMGQNMEFNVVHICEGDDHTVSVNWHLDWKKIQVPFTRGCSCYELSRNRDQLVIKKIQAVIESPIKPGGLAMALFKTITSLCNALPETAEMFLRSSHVIFQLLQKTFSMILQPIVNPLLAWYIKLWSYTVGILTFMLKILQYIAKILYK